jgi:putative hemolysin
MNTFRRVKVAEADASNDDKALPSSPLVKPKSRLFKKFDYEQQIKAFLEENQGIAGFDFVDKVLDSLNFSYVASQRCRNNIPATGRVIIVANYPLGSLDSLALLRFISEVRQDVKLIVDNTLSEIEPLENLCLSLGQANKSLRKNNIKKIIDVLDQDQAIIFFPAGQVSRVRPTGIKDGKWNSAFLKMAAKKNTPILPVHIKGKNSAAFYSLSMLYKPLSVNLLTHEMFKQSSKSVKFKVGELISIETLNAMPITLEAKTALLKKHIYKIGKGKKPLFKTEKTIVHPQSKPSIKQELEASELLGHTQDKHRIYLFDYKPDSAVMREIGRLREHTFRYVGEGTGKSIDVDRYDQYYRHIVLWDENALEIVGAYRIGETDSIIKNKTIAGLYTSELFQFSEAMAPYLELGLELGRSFVQPKYWGKRSLDYLWYGIGAYLRKYPKVRYLLGPVTLSNSYPKMAKDLMVYFYKHYFSAQACLAKANQPYEVSLESVEQIKDSFDGDNYKKDFAVLKQSLDHLGVAVPTLYKQYTELSDDNGVKFLDFGVDPSFNYCIDGLILVDVEKIKPKKYQRYIGEKSA